MSFPRPAGNLTKEQLFCACVTEGFAETHAELMSRVRLLDHEEFHFTRMVGGKPKLEEVRLKVIALDEFACLHGRKNKYEKKCYKMFFALWGIEYPLEM